MGCSSRPCQDSFALFYEDGLSMTVRYRGHHCTQLRLGVVSPVGRDGRPPTFIRVGQEQRERERERERKRERVLYFYEVYQSEPRQYSRPPWMPAARSPSVQFVCDEISLNEVKKAIKKAKNLSAPSPFDAIPYTIYKQCPSLAVALCTVCSTPAGLLLQFQSIGKQLLSDYMYYPKGL